MPPKPHFSDDDDALYCGSVTSTPRLESNDTMAQGAGKLKAAKTSGGRKNTGLTKKGKRNCAPKKAMASKEYMTKKVGSHCAEQGSGSGMEHLSAARRAGFMATLSSVARRLRCLTSTWSPIP